MWYSWRHIAAMIEYDWDAPEPAFTDFETQSRYPLDHGVKRFCRHHSTKALTCSVRVDSVTHSFGPYLNADDLSALSALTEGRTLVAHNAPFDEAIWTEVCGLPKRKWFDTLPAARAAGLPGRLDDLGKLLTGKGKDKNGKALIDMLCNVRNKPIPPADSPAYKLLLAYNRRDVELLEDIFHRVKMYVQLPHVRRTIDVDRAMNERGIPVDVDHLQQLKSLYEVNKSDKQDELKEHMGRVNPNSPKQVKEWMEQRGFRTDSINKHKIKEMCAHPEKFWVGGDDDMGAAFQVVSEAVELRREVSRVGFSKVESALELVEEDGRIRDCLVAFGAGPGRWSSRGPQWHNMPNMMYDVDFHSVQLSAEDIQRAAAEATEAGRARGAPPANNSDILSALIRHCVRADNLLVADYSAVELRMVMWLAEDERALSILADPAQSIYIDMAEQLFGRRVSKKDDPNEYTLSKTLVLGCIYGMSGKKFAISLRDSTHSFGEVDIDPHQAVKTFRNTYPNVPKLWSELGSAMLRCVESRCDTWCPSFRKFALEWHGDDMWIVLPSKRPIVYREARVDQLVPAYVYMYNLPEEPVDTVTYVNWRGQRVPLWGSKAVENVSQGSCADLIMCATAEAEFSADLHPVFSVHDELVCEDGEDRFDDFMRVMSTPPAEWAADFPLLAEGYSGPVWTKQTKKFRNSDWLMGEKLK